MIALFGGTFDPVHLGHLRVAWEVAEYLRCPVRMLPCHVPSHRPPPLFDARTRVEMLRAALRGQTNLTVDTSELSRTGPSYTIDTLIALRAEVGAYEPLVWVIGADAFAKLPTWHRWTELFGLANFLVLSRPGSAPNWDAEIAAEMFARRRDEVGALNEKAAGVIHCRAVTALEVSSSAIRELLLAGRSPRFLVPESVLEVIELRQFLGGL